LAINLNLTQRLTVLLAAGMLLAAFTGYLVWGQGPPTSPLRGGGGWVRTGYNSDTSDTPGQGNFSVWASDSSSQRGTQARWPLDWSIEHNIYVWEVGVTGATSCNGSGV
jgi:hypothetical protein